MLRFAHNLTDCSLYYFALSTQKPVLKRIQLSIDIKKTALVVVSSKTILCYWVAQKLTGDNLKLVWAKFSTLS